MKNNTKKYMYIKLIQFMGSDLIKYTMTGAMKQNFRFVVIRNRKLDKRYEIYMYMINQHWYQTK